jgi:ankyrin repeat protein
MGSKKILTVLLGYKFLLVIFCLSVVYIHYVVGKVWFNRTVTLDQIYSDLGQGADPNAYNDEGLTGLMEYSKTPDVGIVRALLNAGADPNLLSKNEGNTALHFACVNGGMSSGLEIIKLLIKNNAYVRARNKLGETPLHKLSLVADVERSIALMTYIIKQGAEINAQSSNGNTLLHTLVEMGELSTIRPYVQKFGPLIKYSLVNNKQYTAAAYAQFLGFTDIATAIINGEQRFSNIPSFGQLYLGMTGIMFAIIKSDRPLLLRYIQQRENINAVSFDEYGNTALHIAELYGNYDFIRILLENNAQRTIANKSGDTPVHYIVKFETSFKRLRAAELILSGDAASTINAQNSDGDTLLHMVVRLHDTQLLEFLIEKFSDVLNITIQNNNGKSPLALAQELNYQDIIDLFAQLEIVKEIITLQ